MTYLVEKYGKGDVLHPSAKAAGFLNTFSDGRYFFLPVIRLLCLLKFQRLPPFQHSKVCGFDISPYPNVVTWFDRSKAIAPAYEINEEHHEAFKTVSNNFSLHHNQMLERMDETNTEPIERPFFWWFYPFTRAIFLKYWISVDCW